MTVALKKKLKHLIPAKVRNFLRTSLQSTQTSFKDSDEDFISMTYQVLLGRDVDSTGLQTWLQRLQNGLSRVQLVAEILESPEWKLRLEHSKQQSQQGEVLQAFHQARLQIVRECLPAGQVILDVGGAHHADHRGALLNFGYPHLPEKLYIIDLPPTERMFPVEADQAPPQQWNYNGCQIEYCYQSMSDLSNFEDNSIDLVWSGESIEHITVDEASVMLRHIHRILKPGGTFAFDTPNRRVTKLLNPEQYIHPEHKIEYYVNDLKSFIEQHNFTIQDIKGIVAMPKSVQGNVFLNEEAISNPTVNDSPENSFMFYMCCTAN